MKFGHEIIKDFEIMDELTEFALAGDHEAWWIPAYWWNRYEYLYQKSTVSAIDTVHTPFTMETEDGLFLSFHEAALTDFASMTLWRKKDHTYEAGRIGMMRIVASGTGGHSSGMGRPGPDAAKLEPTLVRMAQTLPTTQQRL